MLGDQWLQYVSYCSLWMSSVKIVVPVCVYVCVLMCAHVCLYMCIHSVHVSVSVCLYTDASLPVPPSLRGSHLMP